MRRPFLICLVLVVVTVAAYWPVRRAEFLNFDDPDYVTNNPRVHQGLTLAGVKWAFTAFHASNWHPLTWISHMADSSIFGDHAAGHHFMNVGLHVLNTVLLLILLWRLTGALWRSAFVAGFFALHPLHVESVAWVSERKDVLSTLFFLLTLLAYAQYAAARRAGAGRAGEASASSSSADRRPRAWVWCGCAMVCFALGLMSKPMLVTLPFVLLLLDFWPLRRLQVGEAPGISTLEAFRLVWEKAPFLALSVASCAVTLFAQRAGGALVPVEIVPVGGRIANATVSYASYLGKTFWPSKLAAFYPIPAEIWIVEALLALVLLIGLSAAAWFWRRRSPAVLIGWCWFLGTLVPVSGLVQVGSQAMADRYTYIPLIGLFIALVWGLADWAERTSALTRAFSFGGTIALALCFWMTQIQVRYWQNSLTLFSHALSVTTDSFLAEHNYGHALSLAGNQREAFKHFDRALQLSPGHALVYFNRGNAYALEGKLDEAITDYREAIRNRPNYAQAYCNLAKALVQKLQFDEARTNFLAAIRHKPDYAEAHTKLGNLLLLEGKRQEALVYLRRAVEIDPRYDEGQYFLGGALAREGELAQAAACFRAAIEANPGHGPALNDLAWLLASRTDELRNVPEALRLARRACELTGEESPSYLDTLGVAYSEAGQIAEAVALTEKALRLAEASGDDLVAAELRRRLDTYAAGLSYTQARGKNR